MGMIVDNYSGKLAFKSTHLTRWLLNPPIPEADALRESLQHERYIIEWEGHGNIATEPTETTISELASHKTDDIVGKRFNLKIKVSKVNNPKYWWFYACTRCCKKMVLAGSIRKCPICKGTKDDERYKLSVRAEDINPTDIANEVIGDFVFFGNRGTTLTGREANLLVSQVKGRLDYIPPSIANIVGNTYAITAEVDQETLDKKRGHIISKVSKVEPFTPPPAIETASVQHNPPATEETHTLTDTLAAIQDQSETSKDLEATPVKDVIDSACSDATEDITTSDGKKRKNPSTGSRTLKKDQAMVPRDQLKFCFSLINRPSILR